MVVKLSLWLLEHKQIPNTPEANPVNTSAQNRNTSIILFKHRQEQ